MVRPDVLRPAKNIWTKQEEANLKRSVKRFIALVLYLMTVLAILPVGETEAATSYSMYSSKKVKLQIPGEKYLMDELMTAKVKGTSKNNTNYILPKPETGNGEMGTVKKDARVVILAEKNDYYMLMTTAANSAGPRPSTLPNRR